MTSLKSDCVMEVKAKELINMLRIKHSVMFSFLSACACSYCVYLRVKQASAACKLKLWSAQLVRERLVCAECQSDAMSKTDRCGGEGLERIR